MLLMPLLFSLFVRTYWTSNNLIPPTGDEPHYLILSNSLMHFDANVRSEYAKSPYDPHVFAASSDRWYSLHYPGLSMLVGPLFVLGGVTGVRIFLICLTGCLPWIFFRVLRRQINSEVVAALFAVALCIGLPFTTASGQIYPDLIVGLIILYVTDTLLQALANRAMTDVQAIAVCLLTACLPWFHIKAIAQMLLIVAVYVWILFRCATLVRARELIVKAGLLALPLLSGIGIIIYNLSYFNSLLGPGIDNQSGRFSEWIMVFLGLHLDQAQGLFVQQPLLLLGLVGIPILVHKRRHDAIILGALYLSMVLPNAMHSNWYGGGSFSGRFMVSAFVLWIFPLAYTLHELFGLRPVLGKVLPLSAITFEGVLASSWVTIPQNLYNTRPKRNTIFPDWMKFSLPSFYDFSSWYHNPINWLAVIACIGAIAIGWLVYNQRSLAAKRVALFVLLAGGYCLPGSPNMEFVTEWWQPRAVRVFEAEKLPTNITSAEVIDDKAASGGKIRSVRLSSKPAADALMFGPYVEAAPGRYTAVFFLKGQCGAGEDIAGSIQAFSTSRKMLVQQDVHCSELTNDLREYRLPFLTMVAVPDLELRCMYHNVEMLAVDKVELRPE